MKKKMKRQFFITGTDTDVGKTVTTYVLAMLLKEQGFDIGVMKPVQCSGNDAEFLKNKVGISDDISEINPYYAKYPLSPDIAFAKSKKKIKVDKILLAYEKLKSRHDILLVEGAGGAMVPIQGKYLMADLMRDLGTEAIIVSRLGLGTINHTLLTIEKLKKAGVKIKGIIFSETEKEKDILKRTNPKTIARLSSIPCLGIVKHFKDTQNISVKDILTQDIDVKKILKQEIKHTNRLKTLDKQYIWHPFTQMQDWLNEDHLVIDEAKGSYLIDTDGNRYLDGVSSLWVNVHGHRKKKIDDAIRDQLGRLSHSTLLGLSNTPAVELAEKLVEITPDGLEKVFYSDNGSTSVEIAVKIAYQYWQNIGKTKKTGIVHLENSYHGDTLGSVSVGGIDLFHKVYRKLIFKAIKLKFPDCYRAPKGRKYPQYAFESLEALEKLFKKDGNKIAALLVEPCVQGAAGMIVWPKGILKKMEQLCRKYGVLLIADEVATGFGRTGKMFACEHETVRPDIMCVAKGLTGGYLPLAATLTTKKIFNGFLFDYESQKTFFHGHTYTGNPLCCAAALANLDVFREEKVLEKMSLKIEVFKKGLRRLKNLKLVGDIRQKGFMVGIELVKDKRTKESLAWQDKVGIKVCQKVRDRGVILRPLGNVIVIMPPLSISNKELKYLLETVYWAIQEVGSNI